MEERGYFIGNVWDLFGKYCFDSRQYSGSRNLDFPWCWTLSHAGTVDLT